MFSIIKKNIKTKIILFLFIGSAIISTLFAFYNYNTTKERLVKKLEDLADDYVNRISENLIIPLWEVDSDWALKTIDTEMDNEQLIAISVSGEGGLYVARERSEANVIQNFSSFSNKEGTFLERTKPIVRNSEEIGSVTIYVTRKFLDERLLNEAQSIIIFGAFLVLFLIASIYVTLEYFVLKPLGHILTIVKNTSKNDYSKRVEISQEDEIGRLADGFNEMIQSILDKEEMMMSQSRQAAMGEMISMIAHQWRQPITVIAMGANNMLADIELEQLKTEDVENDANMILKQTMHLSKTIDDFRNFFSPNKEKTLELINDIIEDSLKVIGKSLENNNVAIERKLNSMTPIKIHSRELLQVLLNIIKNAKEALLENKIKNGIISIETKEDEDNIYIIICDNGKGIPANIIKKVFNPYFTTKSEKNGTGLGLYMSKTIVHKHLDGKMEVKNREVGGVCFSITIPKEEKENNE